jgi:hypothetical protein
MKKDVAVARSRKEITMMRWDKPNDASSRPSAKVP